MEFDVVQLAPANYVHTHAFDEMAETVCWGLKQLGYAVTFAVNRVRNDVPTVLFGANLLAPEQMADLPDSVIVYNLEQVAVESPWFSEERLAAFRSRRVFWDYSRRNLAQWEQCGVSGGVYVPVGYAPTLSRIGRGKSTTDVIFYGSMNPRRQRILDSLRSRGLTVVSAFGEYGATRDALIAQAKVALNVHFYPTSILEMVRISYLLANRVPVVSERHDGTEVDGDFDDALVFSAYDHLVESCWNLVQDEQARETISWKGFEIMQQRSIIPILSEALTRSKVVSTEHPIGKHRGSGAPCRT